MNFRAEGLDIVSVLSAQHPGKSDVSLKAGRRPTVAMRADLLLHDNPGVGCRRDSVGVSYFGLIRSPASLLVPEETKTPSSLRHLRRLNSRA